MEKSIYIDTDRFFTEKEFNNAIQEIGKSDQQRINSFKAIVAYFMDKNVDSNSFFAMAIFVNGEVIDKRFIITPKPDAGIRICRNLKELPENLYKPFLTKLCRYFTTQKGNDRSEYQNSQDFIFDIHMLRDGMKAISYSTLSEGKKIVNPAGIDKVQENHCSVDQDIPKFMEDWFIGSDQLPYHQLKISYKDIFAALETLHLQYYTTLNLWFFPERKPINAEMFDKQWNLKYNENKSARIAAWRSSKVALDALAKNIIFIQESKVL